jgi:hypothetical protein
VVGWLVVIGLGWFGLVWVGLVWVGFDSNLLSHPGNSNQASLKKKQTQIKPNQIKTNKCSSHFPGNKHAHPPSSINLIAGQLIPHNYPFQHTPHNALCMPCVM